mmetsp:Transcript_64/g.177  ORF Transcript_64/g.177 Transcript_64/m.177 type:complete len:300 (-) Transcript_64:234-1133(-)
MALRLRATSLCLAALCFAAASSAAADGTCANDEPVVYDYSKVIAEPRNLQATFKDLPGFTRSFYERDHALITPESRVWAGFPGWKNAVTAHLITPASGAHFVMYLVNMSPAASSAPPGSPAVERFMFVIQGEVSVEANGKKLSLPSDHYAYFPPSMSHSITSSASAQLVVFERKYGIEGGKPTFQSGNVSNHPHLLTPGEVFGLRKLMPMTGDYDFNIHIMDFKPGEHLNVKEVHYNQHGLLLLQGKGIYRLADKWFPVQAGDAIYMGPFVPQWYAALGYENSRYLLYKDTTVDPLLSP